MTNQQDKYQRAIPPIPDRPHMGLTTYDAKDPNIKFPPIEGDPNVLVILIGDVGFGASSCQTTLAKD
jgi:arylsulfatase